LHDRHFDFLLSEKAFFRNIGIMQMVRVNRQRETSVLNR
jgi:hypothetical protein